MQSEPPRLQKLPLGTVSHNTVDAVEYHLYLDQIVLSRTHGNSFVPLLIAVRAQVLDFVGQWTQRYLWQKAPFNLCVCDQGSEKKGSQKDHTNKVFSNHSSSRSQIRNIDEHEEFMNESYEVLQGEQNIVRFSSIPHLMGRTAFGDNIVDEWFIVFLIQQITRRFPDITAQVYDNDGQFLLIEAANAIPRWLNPENSDARVWIRSGRLHILPRPCSPAELVDIPLSPSVEQGLAVVASSRYHTEASHQVQWALSNKLGKQPQEALQASSHTIRCLLPLSVATVLRRFPALIAPTVEAFYLRDPVDLRVCSKMARFHVEESNLVWSQIQLTRCMYAQLKQQQFHPPKCFSRLPSIAVPRSDHRYPAIDMGVKITCGMEMWYQQLVRRISKQQQESEKESSSQSYNQDQKLDHEIQDNQQNKVQCEAEEAQQELKQLQIAIYLRHRGCTNPKSLAAFLDYNQAHIAVPALFDPSLELQFQNCYLQPNDTEPLILKAIDQEMDAIGAVDSPAFSQSIKQFFDSYESTPPGDDDSWMTISNNELDEIVRNRANTELDGKDSATLPHNQRQAGQVEDFDVEQVVHSMNSFMEESSGLDGIDPLPSKPKPKPKSAQDTQSEFDVEKLMAILENQLELTNDNEKDDEDNYNEDEDDYLDDIDDEYDGDDDERNSEKENLMKQMEQELYNAGMFEGFEGVANMKEQANGRKEHVDSQVHDEQDEQDQQQPEQSEFSPVNVDLNLVKNILKSYSSQQGAAGPVSNLLGSLGVDLLGDIEEEPPNS